MTSLAEERNAQAQWTSRLRHAAWAKVVRSTGPVLSLKYVDAIERAPGGKYQVFTSDFTPASDRP